VALVALAATAVGIASIVQRHAHALVIGGDAFKRRGTRKAVQQPIGQASGI
jgi:hypothetical protein